jgi:hypothetical protein
MKEFWDHVKQEMEGEETARQHGVDHLSSVHDEGQDRGLQEVDVNNAAKFSRYSRRDYAQQVLETSETDIETLQDAKVSSNCVEQFSLKCSYLTTINRVCALPTARSGGHM